MENIIIFTIIFILSGISIIGFYSYFNINSKYKILNNTYSNTKNELNKYKSNVNNLVVESRRLESLKEKYEMRKRKAIYVSLNWYNVGNINDKFNVTYYLSEECRALNNNKLFKFKVDKVVVPSQSSSKESFYIDHFYTKATDDGWLNISSPKFNCTFDFISEKFTEDKRNDDIENILN